jgi:RNA-directed DNA polymerase
LTIIQNALRHVLEPIFEKDFAEQSYGFRPGRSCRDALTRVETLLADGYVHVVDADLKGYFDTIDHELLMERVKSKISDSRVLALLEQLLQQQVMDGLHTWQPEQGTPQGAVISPLLSNIYLDPLDHLLAEHGYEMVRYADDFVVLCRTSAEAEAVLELIRTWTTQVRLTLHPTKTHIVDVRQTGFDFLGYHFYQGKCWPRQKSRSKIRDSIRTKTKRNSGQSLATIIHDLNRTLHGWFNYFQYSHPVTFRDLDGWIRMRLRSILRRRRGKRGRGQGRDHQRWPNAYFHSAGLYSLEAAHLKLCQSSRR